MRKALLFVAACGLLLSCDDPGGKVTGIDRTGVVSGLAYIDRNADGLLTLGTDVVAQGVTAALLLDATGDTIQRATTNAGGTFTMERVPIGRYRLVATRGALGDSVEVLTIDSAQFALAAGDTIVRLVPLGFPTITAEEVRTIPAGRRVMVKGIALNGWATFADSTIHVADNTGTIRSVRVLASQIQAGDSVRIFGTTGTRSGGIVITDATTQLLGAGVGLPAIDSVSTADAATAGDGARIDGQVRIAGAIVLDTATVAGDLVLGVDDGSGPVDVVLDRHINFNAAQYTPGATFTGAGVLVPSAAGTYSIKPREAAEVVISFPNLSIADARALEEGRQVVVEGLALNGWSAFGDSTLHVRDATGAIRGVRVPNSNAVIGDSVRLIGTTALRDGQPVLTAATATRLLAGVGLPVPDSITTAAAAAAQGGTRDADRVRAAGQIVGTENRPNGDLILSIDDGSGMLEVMLDKDVTFAAAPYVAGAMLNAAGVLVPNGSGAWMLKPANAADVTAFYRTVTIAEARALQVGLNVQVVGVALNSRDDFGDATVHLEDATGTLRATSVGSAPPVLAGYTIRIVGTIDILNGMPILKASGISQVITGTLAAPDSVSTQVAADADGGNRDAGYVAVSGTITAVATNATNDHVLTIDDGSGPLDVVLDIDRFPTNPYTVGLSIAVRGVLVPNSTGTAWRLKPRGVPDVHVN